MSVACFTALASFPAAQIDTTWSSERVSSLPSIPGFSTKSFGTLAERSADLGDRDVRSVHGHRIADLPSDPGEA